MDNIKKEELDWSYEELLCFLLIHASYADMEFTEDEKHMIINKYGHKSYEKMNDIYDGLGEYERLATILKYKGVYYPTVDRKGEILNEISKLFEVDGSYSKLEKTQMNFLNKLL